jgi:hypothetical protein
VSGIVEQCWKQAAKKLERHQIDVPLNHEIISDQASASGMIQFMAVDSFPASGFSWDKMYQNSVRKFIPVHSALACGIWYGEGGETPFAQVLPILPWWSYFEDDSFFKKRQS